MAETRGERRINRNSEYEYIARDTCQINLDRSTNRETIIDPLKIIFVDEHDQRLQELEEKEQLRRDQLYHLQRDAYSQPSDPNIEIYPKRRGRYPWDEHIERNWYDASPNKLAEINRKKSIKRSRTLITKRVLICP